MNRNELVSLVQSHQAQIYRYLRYLGAGLHVAEDLAQETFVVAFHKSTQGPGIEVGHPAAWLRGVARNLFLAHCRRAKNDPVPLDMAFVEQAEGFWAREFPGASDARGHLEALQLCVQGLPPRERELVDLQYRQKKSRADLAVAAGLSEEGVKTLMRRLRAGLAQCIEKRLKAGGSPCP
ncbi:MAG: sigma-70 family RNA polymerase sigma factor [Planctomycetota bacterium]|nr:sigma-70 family RNA polymerase sigma factor [Planctomycetota bacterium]